MTKLSSTVEVTQQRIDRYGIANGDREMMHYDESYARSRGYRGAVAHGTMLLAPVVDLAMLRYGETFLTCGVLSVRWTAPICAGDVQVATIDATGAIEAVNASLSDRPVTLRGSAKCEGEVR
jgi:3-hydroxybutyryl-CoA dehydratase